MPAFDFSGDQWECVTYDASPHFRITGVAGSGKTIVLLWRAARLAERPTPSRTILFTFNKTLVTYSGDLLTQNGFKGRLKVINFHKWAWRKLPTYVQERDLVSDRRRRELIEEALGTYRATQTVPSSSIFERSFEWWSEELQWVKGQGYITFEEYARSERKGRGTGLGQQQRQHVWNVLTSFDQRLSSNGLFEFEDYARELLRLYNPPPERERYDHILVDEVQDLGGGELRLLRRLARQSLTLVEDLGQKLYRRAYDFNDLDIEVAGFVPGYAGINRTKRLGMSFRSTRQIMQLVDPLRKADTSLDPQNREGVLPQRSGPLPTLYAAPTPLDEDTTALRWAVHLARVHPSKTVAIISCFRSTLEGIQGRLPTGTPVSLILDREGEPLTPGIKLTTFHSSKGLEFDYVILIHVNDDVIPGPLPAMPNAASPEEQAEHEAQVEAHLNTERRLLYVAMTRARHGLYIIHSHTPSRFLSLFSPEHYERSDGSLE